MNPLSKILILAGALLITAGALWNYAGKYLPLGRLPGDIAIEKPGFGFYFPITTSILVSLLLTGLLYLIQYFKRN